MPTYTLTAFSCPHIYKAGQDPHWQWPVYWTPLYTMLLTSRLSANTCVQRLPGFHTDYSKQWCGWGDVGCELRLTLEWSGTYSPHPPHIIVYTWQLGVCTLNGHCHMAYVRQKYLFRCTVTLSLHTAHYICVTIHYYVPCCLHSDVPC